MYYSDPNADGVYDPSLPVGHDTQIQTVSNGFVRTFRRGGSETYDTLGRIRFTTDASGVVTSYTRDGQGRMSSITRRGRSLSFEYTSTFTVPALVLGAGGTLLATYTCTGQRRAPRAAGCVDSVGMRRARLAPSARIVPNRRRWPWRPTAPAKTSGS